LNTMNDICWVNSIVADATVRCLISVPWVETHGYDQSSLRDKGFFSDVEAAGDVFREAVTAQARMPEQATEGEFGGGVFGAVVGHYARDGFASPVTQIS